MKTDLPLELAKVLLKHEPLLLQCDMEANARGIGAVAHLLGCLLATPLAKMEQAEYLKCLDEVFRFIDKTAVATVEGALRIKQDPTNLTEH